ncbi:sn-glycerol-3-phosphate ABC transporter ATP-binding protein UgpC [Parasalinivibrio latis]|uniref:ABC transporter ATP-binding protein n=1 Tax=Parasalinivibrio latis TaxID=2952610 RepID=UPI0030E2834A
MANIKLSNVVKKYPSATVIHGVDLTINNGEFVVFVGPSGCGKSTLLRLIAGLEEISDGELEIDNAIVNHVDPAERGIAMVFQSYALYPHMSVEQNMGFALRMNNVPRKEVQERVQQAAEILQLDHLMSRKPKALSGGQRQRVAIGRAIVRNPKVFLFDEPLSNLDAELRVDMRLQIAKLHEDLKSTMIYVTHDQVEAMTLADKIVVLRDGKIEQVGTPLELYRSPANEFVAGFIGSPKMNMLPANVVSKNQNTVVIELPNASEITIKADTTGLEIGSEVMFGIRPEHIYVDQELENQVLFKTDAVERLGNSTYLFGEFGGFNDCRVHLPWDKEVRRGETLSLTFNSSDCHLFHKGICISNT